MNCEEFRDFMNSQVEAIQEYISANEGNSHDMDLINSWIQNHAKSFRKSWIKNYHCKYSK